MGFEAGDGGHSGVTGNCVAGLRAFQGGGASAFLAGTGGASWFPVSFLWLHPRVKVFCDAASGGCLGVGRVE